MSDWVARAVSEQEEHIKRSRPCTDGRPHRYRPHGIPHASGRPGLSGTYEACIVCGVPELPRNVKD